MAPVVTAPLRPRPGTYAAIAAVSAAVIAFQLVVMQLLAASQWHHFAYMVISMALLGFGAAGTVLALSRAFLARHYATAVPLLYLLCGVTMAATAWLSGLFGDFDAFLLFFDGEQVGLLLVLYLAYSLPFFFGGLAITLVFYQEVGRIGALYFANMVGSGAGAVLVIALLWIFAADRLPGLLALLPLLAAWLVRPERVSRRALTGIAAAALAAPVVALIHASAPAPSQYKTIYAALLLPNAEVVHRASSPYGRLEIVRADALRFAPALSLRYLGEPPVRDVVFNNGEYFGTLLGRVAEGETHVLDWTTRGLPYAVGTPGSVLVLDARTGNDVSQAISHGVDHVIAVEPHRQVNRLLRDLHPEWIDGIYRDPAVELHGTSPRAFLARPREEPYDLIVLPVLGAFGGTSGVGALQERYELTVEAFSELWAALSPTGMIGVTVWDDQPPRKTLRLLATWREGLARQGIDDPERHLAALRSWGTVTYLAQRSAWTPTQVERMRDFGRDRGFDPLILPGVTAEERERLHLLPDPGFLDMVDALVSGDPAPLIQQYPFDLRPVTDDRPFFGHFLRWSGLPELYRIFGARELPYLELGFVLGVVTFVQIVLAAFVLILLPLFRVGWSGTRRRWTLLYFAGTGTGFMLFEIVLIQKLVLYLGQPVYAAAAVLTTLLVCSGLGSLASSRLPASGRVLALAGLMIAMSIVLYGQWLMPLLGASMSWSLPARTAVVFVLLAPPAFVMGMMFPLGLRRLAGSDESHIPWACGIDSSLSVAATALATIVALEAGFGAVMLLAAAAYVIVGLAGPRLGNAVP